MYLMGVCLVGGCAYIYMVALMYALVKLFAGLNGIGGK